MNTRGICFLATLGATVGYLFGQQPPLPAAHNNVLGGKGALNRALGSCFVENRGQWDHRAQFLLQRPGLNVWLTKDGALLDQYKIEGSTDKTKRQGDIVKMSFTGANRSFTHGLKELPGTLNFMRGADRSKWATNVHRYAEVQTNEIYKGISARYYMENGLPRYDLIVQPGADPSQIAMKFDGAKSVKLSTNGTLQIKTRLGFIEEKGLVAYQEIEGKQERVTCQLQAKGNQAGFTTGTYDHSKPLIIDPLFYSSYMYSLADQDSQFYSTGGGGGLGWDSISQNRRLAYDAKGNLVIVGSVSPTDAFPSLVGGYQTTFSGNGADALLMKLASTDSSLMFATYFGGTSEPFPLTEFTIAMSLNVNADGTITIAGNTGCYNFPTTPGAYMSCTGVETTLYYFAGFMAKFSSTGGQLVDCTLFPNPVTASAVDSAGDVWITGNGNGDTPVTDDSKAHYQNGGGYLTELDPTLSRLAFSHYFYGSTQIGVQNPATCFRPTGLILSGTKAYVMALQAPSDIGLGSYSLLKPTAGAVFTTGASCIEAYDTEAGKILGITLLQPTLTCMALLPNGNLVVGGTAAAGLPTTTGVIQKTAGPGSFSHYIAVISPTLTDLVAATYFGGEEPANTDVVYSNEFNASGFVGELSVDNDGNIVICAMTNDTNTPTTSGASMPSFPSTLNGLSYWNITSQSLVGYIAKFSPDLKSLLYGSLVPGVGSNLGVVVNGYQTGYSNQMRLLLDDKSNALIFGVGLDYGFGTSTTFFATPNALLKEPFANEEFTFLMGISMVPGPKMSIAQPGVIGGGSTTCTITLTSAAPTGGLKVPLKMIPATSSITIPSSVTIPAGQTQASFPISTVPVATKQHVVIQAQFGTDYQQVLFTDLTPQIASVTVTPMEVEQGGNVTVDLKLNAAPAAGFVIRIDSWASGGLSHGPPDMVFKAGQTEFKETFATDAVAFTADNPDYSGPNGDWSQPQFSLPNLVTEYADPISFTLGQSSVTAGTELTGTITLDGPAPDPEYGEMITLSSSDAAAAFIPASFVPALGVSSFTVPIRTFAVSAATKITLTAKGSQLSATTSFVLEPAGIVSLTPASSTVFLKGQDTLTVLLNGLAPSGAVATLSSSNTAAATVPATCPLSKSSASSTFTVTAGSVSAPTPMTISATYAGATRTAAITVLPNGPSSVAFHYVYVYGGQAQAGIVTLSQPVTASTIVNLVSSNATVAPVPKTVTVATGASSATFSVTPIGVAAVTTITATASLNGVTASSSFQVQPSPLYALTLASSSVASNSSTTCTVHLNGYTPPTGAVVSLKSSSTAAVVPATVTIPAQTNNAAVTVKTGKVSVATTVTITAVYGGVTKTINLTVNP